VVVALGRARTQKQAVGGQGPVSVRCERLRSPSAAQRRNQRPGSLRRHRHDGACAVAKSARRRRHDVLC